MKKLYYILIATLVACIAVLGWFLYVSYTTMAYYCDRPVHLVESKINSFSSSTISLE